MKVRFNNLGRFIKDFELQNRDGVICFDAVILYTTLKKQYQVPSEVHILFFEVTEMYVIFLLDQGVIEHNIPHRIENNDSVFYRAGEFLYIKGHSAVDGNYILSIHPTGDTCKPPTLRELYSKTYN